MRSRIDRHARAAKIEAIGNTVRQTSKRVAGCEMAISNRRIAVNDVGIISQRPTDINASARSMQRGWEDAGILQRFPRQLQQNALLWIDLLGLARRYSKQSRIKPPNIIQGGGCKSVTLASLLAARMQIGSLRKSICRKHTYCAPAVDEHRPEFGDRICPRQPARPSHHCDLIARAGNRRNCSSTNCTATRPRRITHLVDTQCLGLPEIICELSLCSFNQSHHPKYRRIIDGPQTDERAISGTDLYNPIA